MKAYIVAIAAIAGSLFLAPAMIDHANAGHCVCIDYSDQPFAFASKVGNKKPPRKVGKVRYEPCPVPLLRWQSRHWHSF